MNAVRRTAGENVPIQARRASECISHNAPNACTRSRVGLVLAGMFSPAVRLRAICSNGRILPSEPVDWPEGSQLRVEPFSPPREKIGLSEDEWRDDPDSIAAWIDAVEKIEPLIWAEGDEEEFERWRAKCRQFNTEAVRQQMEAMPEGDAP